MARIGQTSIFQELLEEVVCEASVAIGDWIYLNSSNIGVSALADSEANSHIIGLVEDKPSATRATVRTHGISSELFTGLDVTKDYFLDESTAGAMTITPPTGSNEVVLRVGRPFSDKRFWVQMGIRMVRAT